MNARDIERRIYGIYGSRAAIMVPRVSCGLVYWGECDILMMSGAGYLTEFEIKVSASDLRREWKKDRWNNAILLRAFRERIKKYYIVMPDTVFEKAGDCIPETIGAGVLVLPTSTQAPQYPRVPIRPRANAARKLTQQEQFQLARLGCFRYWTEINKK